MRIFNQVLIAAGMMAVIGAAPVMAVDEAPVRDLGREVLAPNDGWAAEGAGTTGGSTADATQVYTVSNRAQFIAALNNGVPSSTSPSAPSDLPKIIYVNGVIDFNVDDNNQPLTCQSYYRNGYTLEGYLAAYDPATWGRVPPSGEMETARIASAAAQSARVRIRVGSNTTIVGLSKTAELRGVWLDIRGSSTVNRRNIIIRNITFSDTFDCFTAWDPTDGSSGAWNAAYDSISLRNADHVWIDHNTFRDKNTLDANQPTYFGVKYQVHDGLVDITNASDFVTVSWNRFLNHDKVTLVGSSDSASADRGKLRVTFHHNLYDNTGQRTPRVRFGQVDVYNNYYKHEVPANFVYSWGVGIESQIYAENNYFKTHSTVTPDMIIERFNGTMIQAIGNRRNSTTASGAFDPVAAWNAVNDPDLSPTVLWVPTLRAEFHATSLVPSAVQNTAGPQDWQFPAP